MQKGEHMRFLCLVYGFFLTALIHPGYSKNETKLDPSLRSRRMLPAIPMLPPMTEPHQDAPSVFSSPPSPSPPPPLLNLDQLLSAFNFTPLWGNPPTNRQKPNHNPER